MPNEKNLIPNSERSPDELREMARRGGQASGAARRRKRDMKNAARMILSLPADEQVSSLLSQLGIPEEDQTMQVAILAAMAMKARSGDVRASEFLRDTAGENPRQKLEEKRFAAEQSANAGGTDIVKDWIDSTGAESPCGSGITASPGKRPGSCHRTAGPPCQNNLRVKSKVKLTWGYRNDKITLSPTKEGVFK